MPPRPSATGTTTGPARNHPSDRRPGRATTRIVPNAIRIIHHASSDRAVPADRFPNSRLLFYACVLYFAASCAANRGR